MRDNLFRVKAMRIRIETRREKKDVIGGKQRQSTGASNEKNKDACAIGIKCFMIRRNTFLSCCLKVYIHLLKSKSIEKLPYIAFFLSTGVLPCLCDCRLKVES